MPSPLALPTIDDLLKAAGSALVGERDRYGDKHRGALYEHVVGPTAILFSQEADRDQDLFQDIYFDDAIDDGLTKLIEGRFKIARILDTAGIGTCTFARTTAAAGAGSFLQGTRIQLAGTPPAVYVVRADTAVGGAATRVQIPIASAVVGSGVAVSAVGGLSLLDAVYDPLWAPLALLCTDGTDFEEAPVYRARARAERLNARSGYLPQFVTACQNAGAAYVLAFSSTYGLVADDFDNDFGLNAVYVADASHQSSPALVDACALALEASRVFGADLWVGGITQQRLSVQAKVTLVDDPGNMNVVPIERALTQAVLGEFGPSASGYSVKRQALAGAMARASSAVQTVTFSAPAADTPALSPLAWPASLTRWTLSPMDVAFTFLPPV
jgi:hypothetical protein